MGADIAAVEDALAALTGTHYTAAAVDVIVGGLADAINARIEAYPIVSGQKYNAFTHGVGGADIPAPTQIESGFIYFSIIDLPVSATFDRIGTTVRTAGAGVTARLGIFDIDLMTREADLIADAGEIDASTTGDKELTIDVALGPGRYALAIAASGIIEINGAPAARGFDWSSTSNIPRATRLMSGVTYGAFSSSYTINTANGNVYDTYLRAA